MIKLSLLYFLLQVIQPILVAIPPMNFNSSPTQTYPSVNNPVILEPTAPTLQEQMATTNPENPPSYVPFNTSTNYDNRLMGAPYNYNFRPAS